jgi:hypothetical protein
MSEHEHLVSAWGEFEAKVKAAETNLGAGAGPMCRCESYANVHQENQKKKTYLP